MPEKNFKKLQHLYSSLFLLHSFMVLPRINYQLVQVTQNNYIYKYVQYVTYLDLNRRLRLESPEL